MQFVDKIVHLFFLKTEAFRCESVYRRIIYKFYYRSSKAMCEITSTRVSPMEGQQEKLQYLQNYSNIKKLLGRDSELEKVIKFVRKIESLEKISTQQIGGTQKKRKADDVTKTVAMSSSQK